MESTGSPDPHRDPRITSIAAHRLRRWAWLPVLSVGAALYEAVRATYVSTGNANLVPSLLLLGAVTGPATFVIFIYGRRWEFHVSAMTVFIVAFLGGICGVLSATVLEYRTLTTLGGLPMVAVAVIEESVKLLAPLVVLLLTRRPRPADGLLVGIASGAGFAIMETLGYSAVELIRSHENVAEVDNLLLQRGLFSPTTHMAWTAVTATALWFAASQRWRAPAVALFIAAFAVAVALHTAWDLSGTLTAYVAVGLLSLGALIGTGSRLTGGTETAAPMRIDPASR